MRKHWLLRAGAAFTAAVLLAGSVAFAQDEVTEEDIQEQLGDSYDSYVETYGLNYIKQDMLIGMVDQLLLDEN